MGYVAAGLALSQIGSIGPRA